MDDRTLVAKSMGLFRVLSLHPASVLPARKVYVQDLRDFRKHVTYLRFIEVVSRVAIRLQPIVHQVYTPLIAR